MPRLAVRHALACLPGVLACHVVLPYSAAPARDARPEQVGTFDARGDQPATPEDARAADQGTVRDTRPNLADLQPPHACSAWASWTLSSQDSTSCTWACKADSNYSLTCKATGANTTECTCNKTGPPSLIVSPYNPAFCPAFFDGTCHP